MFLVISSFEFWGTVFFVLGLLAFCSLGAIVIITRDNNRQILDPGPDDEYQPEQDLGIGY